MNPGQFNTVVLFQCPSKSKGSRGESVITWLDIYAPHCFIEYGAVDESLIASQGVDVRTITVTLRNERPILPSYRLQVDGVWYGISSVNFRDGKKRYLTIVASSQQQLNG